MRLPLHVSVGCLLMPFMILADLSNDVQYISEECLPALHHEAIKGSLLVFAKRNNLTDEEMAERLLFIADPANGFTDSVGRSQTRAALGGISAFRNAINAIPALEHYIENPEYRSESLCALGYITKYDNHYFDVAQRLVSAGKLDESFFLGDLRAAIRCHNSGHFLLEEVSRLRMERILVTGKSVSFEDAVSADQFLCESVIDYTNSQEHILAETEIMDLLHQKFDQIVKNSYYRRTWGGGNLSDNEWYAMVTNACQTEIARVMALPEDERLNMTAILDAKIAAIEEKEARAARRAIWKRRLSIGGVSMLTFVVVFAIARRIRRVAAAAAAAAEGRQEIADSR